MDIIPSTITTSTKDIRSSINKELRVGIMHFKKYTSALQSKQKHDHLTETKVIFNIIQQFQGDNS